MENKQAPDITLRDFAKGTVVSPISPVSKVMSVLDTVANQATVALLKRTRSGSNKGLLLSFD